MRFFIQTSVKGADFSKEVYTYERHNTETEAIEKNFMEYYTLRRLSELGGVLVGCLHDNKLSCDHLAHIDAYTAQLDDLNVYESEITNKECHKALIEEMQRKIEGDTDVDKTGLYELDKIIKGFGKKKIYLIGARTSMGKTALALTFMDHLIFNCGKKCAFISVEMPEVSLYKRLVQIRTGYNFDEVAGTTAMKVFLDSSANMYTNQNLIIKKTTNRTIGNIRSMCRRIKRDNPSLEYIFVDYIQKVLSNDPSKQSVQAIEEVSGILTDMADDLNVTMIPLAQLKRQSDPKAFPSLEGLKGASRLEEDADMVMLLHRESRSSEQGVIIVDKNREGATGICEVNYKNNITKFYSEVSDGYS
jgi:replicative DNA helicase